MNCPACKDPALVLAERQGIEIDYCPQCRGVWLDRGELDKIIERAAAASERSEIRRSEQHERGTRERPEYNDYDDEDARARSPKKRRGGFLSDLFEFD